MNDLIKDENGLIKTGTGTAVNPQFMSAQGLAQAQSFANIPTTITSDALSGNATPLKISTPPISTIAEGITGASTALAETIKASDLQRATDAKEAKALQAKNESSNQLKSLMSQITDVQESRPTLEQNAGIDKKVESYNTALTNLEASQRAQQNELRALNTANMTTSGSQAAQSAINRKYAFEQADLSLILSVANRDYVSAQNMVDRKIELALEPLKTQLDFTKLFYEDNKADLTKAEERAFNLKIQENERAYDTAKEFEKRKGDIQMKLLEAGAPTSAVLSTGRATNEDELLTAAGDWLAPKTSSIASAPTVKSINGTDMQWNPATGKWETPSGVVAGAGGEGGYKAEIATTGIQAVNGLMDIAVNNPGIFGRTAGLPLPDFARSDAFRNYQAQLEYLKGNIIPAALTAMREASKTGGALGQVSDREGAWLGSSLGALDMKQTPEAVQKQLVAIKQHLQNWQHAVVQYGGQTPSGKTVTAPDGSQIIITD